ncbi:MAG: radical SAM protein [Candidatus Hecatellales archaeon B24]|nr:MAG: radical SAM protein [Candidatus Hecatellales archaeon B24]
MAARGYRIVLTAERCVMSDYHGSIFLGFCACAPRSMWYPFFYFRFICPSAPTHDGGKAKLAPYGLRKIEAALINYGFSKSDVVVAHPDKIKKFIGPETKVIGVASNDPLGRGPASTTFTGETGFFGGEPYDAWKFRELVSNPKLKRWNAKIVVGGPGSWQLEDEEERRRLGVDVVVVGEGEKVVPPIFEKIINGEDVRGVFYGDVVEIEHMYRILGGTIGGIVEVARGCGRGCRFCIPTMLRFRSRPLEDILAEIRVNVKAGQHSVCLHAEDVLRYKANGIYVKPEAVRELFAAAAGVEGVKNVGLSHFALASVAEKPGLLKEISEIIGVGSRNKPWISGQTGIETGSPRMIELNMPGKVKPFKPEEWPDLVEQAFGICQDSLWIPCGTLVLGLPGETEEDVYMTIELMDRLKPYKSIIVPLFFVPIGSLKGERGFSVKDMKPSHWELILACWDHGMNWAEELASEYVFKMPWLAKTYVMSFMKKVVRRISRKARKEIIRMMEESAGK